MEIGVSFPNITNADIRFASSDNARAHLAGQDAISYVGPSTQAGFAEYRLVVKEKANQVEDTTKKESEKSPKGAEIADQTKHETPNATAVASMAKPASAIQLSNTQVVIFYLKLKCKKLKVQVQLRPCQTLVQTNLCQQL